MITQQPPNRYPCMLLLVAVTIFAAASTTTTASFLVTPNQTPTFAVRRIVHSDSRQQQQQPSSSSSSTSALSAVSVSAAANSTFTFPYLDDVAPTVFPPQRRTLRRRTRSSTRPTSSSTQTQTRQRKFKVYCDMDGVLVDFAQGMSDLFNRPMTSQNIDQIQPRQLIWDKVRQSPNRAFFAHLPWCEDGQLLWKHIEHLQPDILTGVPGTYEKSRVEKFAWCRRELRTVSDTIQLFRHVDKAGSFRWHYPVRTTTTATATTSTSKSSSNDAAAVPAADSGSSSSSWQCNVITCWSERKHMESGENVVLIDDRLDLKAEWERRGGIFIHHKTGHLERTLEQLRQHGILLLNRDEQDEDDELVAEDVIPWNDASLLRP